jgi:hypothetical protein
LFRIVPVPALFLPHCSVKREWESPACPQISEFTAEAARNFYGKIIVFPHGEKKWCHSRLSRHSPTGDAAFVNLEPTQKTAIVGTKVGMFGQGFSSASVVKFGGVASTLVTLSGTTYLTAKVPVGAITAAVTVTTGSTTLTSPQTFKVKPKITSFSPSSGTIGTLVTINGSGLIQATSVKFGTVKATTFTVVSDSQVTADVPSGVTPGAVTISITTPGGTANSPTKFTVN